MTLSWALSSRSRRYFTITLVMILTLAALAAGQTVKPRVKQAVVDSQRVKLAGTVHALARAENAVAVADDAMPVQRIVLMLSRSQEQETALRQLLDEQQTPGSPNYQKWLTPAEFGAQFGPADSDIAAVTSWLASHGFEVGAVPAAKNVIEFTGTAGQVREAFQMQLRSYSRTGGTFWANDSDPTIPAALAPVIRGFVSLNNYPRKHFSHSRGAFIRAANGEVTPQVTVSDSQGNKYYGIGPADFATIYNSTPLLNAGNNGTGQTIGVVGRSQINLVDVANFRSLFGLPAATSSGGDTQIIVNGPDPGVVLPGDELEAALDVQMANASAPGAHVKLVIAGSTTLNDGTDLAALYIVNNNLSDVLTVSYGLCENLLGSFNQFYYFLWEQAAAQGITVTVASGDNGSAGCDDNSSQYTAKSGLAVSGEASTPFNVAVGGTDFNDVTSLTTYWNSTNAAGTLLSAKGYIPEIPWNDSCASVNSTTPCSSAVGSSSDPFGSLQLWAGSGGPSRCSNLSNPSSTTCVSGTPKPTWQQGGITPSDNVRDVPDVSLFAATGGSGSNSFYIICDSNERQYAGGTGNDCVSTSNGTPFTGVGGTSAAAPSFAGVIALAGQKAGGKRLGNVNPLLYQVANQPGASCNSAANPNSSCIFYDVQTGNNSVPCQVGTTNCSGTGNAGKLMVSGVPAYSSGTGYDMATGLGSVNITNLVNALSTSVNNLTATTTSLTVSPVTLTHGSSATISVAVNPTAATGTVSLIGSSSNSFNGGIDFNQLSGGSASWSSTLLPGGTYNVKAHYPGDATYGASDSSAVSVTVNPESSQVIPHLVTYNSSGSLADFNATSVTYGSPYILRLDVMDSSGTLTSTSISSNCLTHLFSHVGGATCPTGTVTLTDNGFGLDGGNFALNTEGSAEDLAISLIGGSHTIVASYLGDASYNASSKTVTVNVAQAATTVSAPTSSSNSPMVGLPVTLTAIVNTQSNGMPPTGTLTFKDNGTTINGTAVGVGTPFGSSYAYTTYTLNYAFSTPGSHSITAIYAGDTNYSGSTSASGLALSVSGSVGISTPTANPNPVAAGLSTTLSATATSQTGSSLSGSIKFSVDGVQLSGTPTQTSTTISVTATQSYTPTVKGTHTVIATYTDTAGSVQSQSLTLTANDSFSQNLGASAVTVGSSGGTGTNTITFTPASGIPSGTTISFYCTSSSTSASCSPTQSAPGSVTVSTAAVTANITYTVPALGASSNPVQHKLPWKLGGGLVFAVVFVFAVPGVRKRSQIALMLLLVSAVAIAASCGGGGGGGTTPTPQTFTFTVHSSATVNGAVTTQTSTFTVTN